MKTKHLTSILMLGALAVACTDRMPTGNRTTRTTEDTQIQASNSRLASARKALVTNIPVTGAAFAGTMSITHVDYDAATNQLLFTGTITTADGAVDTFTGVPGALSRTPIALGSATSPILATNASMVSMLYAMTTQADCSILFLSLQPLHLNLLGLVVDLDAVVLNLHAQSGPGNLLGNLLCAVTGLLNGPGALTAITGLVDRINGILAGV